MRERMHTLDDVLLSRLRCPACAHAVRALDDDDDTIVCAGCNARYPVRNGVPALVTPQSVLYKSLVDDDPKKPGVAAVGTDADRQRDYWETDTAHRPVDHPIVEGFAKQRWRHLEG